MAERARAVTCIDFDERSAELALGILEPTDHDGLTSHAAGCDRCAAELGALAGVADRLSMLAADAEPPVGFELRAVRAMVDSNQAGSASAPRRTRLGWVVAAAAAVTLIAGLTGGIIAHTLAREDGRLAALDRLGVTSTRSGLLVDDRGTQHGNVLLTDGGQPQLTMTLAGLDRGVYRCSIRRPDGSLAGVAGWPVDDRGGGTWTVPLTGAALDAARSGPVAPTVVVTEADGTVVSTAQLR